MTAMLKKQRQFGPLLSEHQHKRVALPQVGGLACRAALGGDLGGRLASRLLGCHRVDFVLVGMRAIAARPYLAPLPRSKLVDPGGKRGPTLRGGIARMVRASDLPCSRWWSTAARTCSSEKERGRTSPACRSPLSSNSLDQLRGSPYSGSRVPLSRPRRSART